MFQNTRWTRFSTNELQSNEAATQFFLCIIPNLFCAGALEISGLWGYNIMQHEALGTVASDNMEPDGIAVPVGCDEDAWVGPEIRTLQ